MIENKDLPQEYVSIRQVWLMQINRCTEAISHRFMQDVKDMTADRIGYETVIESILALEVTLIDFGEATVKSDVDAWAEKNMTKEKSEKEGRLACYRRMFGFIIQTLNKYGMLFDTSPQGYSNVEMKSVHADGVSS